MVLRSSSTTPRGVLVAGICLSFLASLAKASPESVIAEMEKIQGESGLRSAQLGLCLIPLEGEPDDAFGYQVERGLVPASMMKVITTATALEIAGPDYRFTTAIEISGEVDEAGTLNGHLIIRGGGDPTLAESQIASTFAKWQSSLAEAGVNKLNGSVVGDASIFDNQMLSDTWQWNDMGNYYASGANGLSIHRNLFYCTFRTSSPGARADLIGTDPKLPGIKFFNEMRVGRSGSGDQGYIYGVPYGKVYYLRGTVPADGRSFTIKGALPDPAFFAARAFTKHLSENGFEVTGDPTTIRLLRDAGESVGARQIIHTQTSTTLGSLIKETNHESNNLQAECIHRLIGLEQRDQSSISSSSSATEDYWKSKGIDMTGFYMADGCGLSRSNTTTPRQLAEILYLMAQSENADTFSASLPVAGRSGTLRSIGRGSAAEGRIRAKSGTLDRVRNYCGYVTTRSGDRYAFALFVNNYSSSLSTVKSQIVRVWSKMVSL